MFFVALVPADPIVQNIQSKEQLCNLQILRPTQLNHRQATRAAGGSQRQMRS